jgi:hypothetical protein
MYYNICWLASSGSAQLLDPDFEDPVRHPAPPRMQQPEGPARRMKQIHGNAVRNGDRQEQGGLGRHVAIEPISDEHTGWDLRVRPDGGPMDLPADHRRSEGRAKGLRESKPAAQNVPGWAFRGQGKVLIRRPGRHAGDDSKR